MMPLGDLLWQCFQQNYHADHSNAAIHCATVRYSPITFRLAEQIWRDFPTYQVNDDLRAVWLDRGQYVEDPGRP
jgi:hypothetical protein